MIDTPSHPFFSPHWQAPAALRVPPVQHAWLLAAGSMTTQLQALGKLSVRSLSEQQSAAAADESAFLDLPEDSPCLLREVLLCVDTQPCIYARSLLPLSSLIGANEVLASMAARPLGSELFRFPEAERQRMQACWLPGKQLPASLTNLPPTLLARRSLFLKNGLPLLVAECFLPALWQRLHNA